MKPTAASNQCCVSTAQTIDTLSSCNALQKNIGPFQLIHFSNHSVACGMRRVSADENVMIALHRKMNDITGMKTTHALCECAEILPVRMHDDDDILMAVIWNIASSNSKKNQVSELLPSNVMRPHHSVHPSVQELHWELNPQF